ncbi:MAG: hypothetical protein HQL47_00770 [Gammaproteobacteria bacterium]|nr:hypothetical protein [Gammaproteobacteria bacterium]
MPFRSQSSNPEQDIPAINQRNWMIEYKRLEQRNRDQELQLRELSMELEVMHDLVKVTALLLEKEIGKDADLEVVRQLASDWQSNKSGLH